jgi:hypothetical protein
MIMSEQHRGDLGETIKGKIEGKWAEPKNKERESIAGRRSA